MTDKPIVKIKNWKIKNCGEYYFLTGEVYGHPNFPDGELVRTSKIKSVETKNTIYELGE